MLTTEQRERFLCRGKCTDTYKTGEWITGYYHFVKMDSGALSGVLHVIMIPAGVEYAFTRTLEINLSTLGQCTGLRDKKGTLIFEGDIVKVNCFGWVAVVKWEDKNSRFLGYLINNKKDIIYISMEPAVEIIGNIHDNPEMMEVDRNADAS